MAIDDKALGGMANAKARSGGVNRDAVAARKASSVTAGTTAPKKAASKSGFGIMGNAKPSGRSAVIAASKSTATKAAAGAIGGYAGKKPVTARAKPSGMY